MSQTQTAQPNDQQNGIKKHDDQESGVKKHELFEGKILCSFLIAHPA